ncbi:MAG: hypothetical protein IPM31_11315 [Anaerolineae bacterium]|nr:hypothetical protein [Anaerolineae bacterium]MBL8103988.1 hypothetical protein [Anaerolineales bacterium]MCC7190753.1 hypothetical protein [Anaerolineales bacterium]
MKNKTASIVLILVTIFINSCIRQGKESSVPDNDILRIFYENHNISAVGNGDKPTFEQFAGDVIYQREDIDVNEDGKKEILISGSISLPKWSFFSIYQLDTSDQWGEIYFLESRGWYDSLVQQKFSHPYIFVDFLGSWGGTGVFSVAIDRNIVRCKEEKCDSISFTRYYEGRSGDGRQSSWGYSKGTSSIIDSHIEINVVGYKQSSNYTTNEVCDPSGNLWYNSVFQPTHTVNPHITKKYIWENDKFTEINSKEIPGFNVNISSDSYGDGRAVFMINSFAGENASPQHQMETYNDFFGIKDDTTESPLTLPCFELKGDQNPIWVPKNILMTDYHLNDKSYYVAVNEKCDMVIWTWNSNDGNISSLEQMRFITKQKVEGCDSNFLSFQWVNITQTSFPELVIRSGFLHQTAWIFDVEKGAELIYKASGIVHDEDTAGVQVQLKDKHILLTIGLPYHKEDCVTTFECFSLEKQYEIYVWDDTSQKFTLQP